MNYKDKSAGDQSVWEKFNNGLISSVCLLSYVAQIPFMISSFGVLRSQLINWVFVFVPFVPFITFIYLYSCRRPFNWLLDKTIVLKWVSESSDRAQVIMGMAAGLMLSFILLVLFIIFPVLPVILLTLPFLIGLAGAFSF